VLRRIEEGEEVFIRVLAAGRYEFTVRILAVLALGAAAVPMGEFVQYLVNVYVVESCAYVSSCRPSDQSGVFCEQVETSSDYGV
jgi:hypothetical protein